MYCTLYCSISIRVIIKNAIKCIILCSPKFLAQCYLFHHDEFENMSAEGEREDLGKEEAQTHHSTYPTKHQEPLRSGHGLDGRVEPSFPRLVEESGLQVRGW